MNLPEYFWAAGLIVLAVGLAALFFVLFRRCSNADLRKGSLDIAIFAGGLVGIVLTGILVPYQINQASNARLDRSTCFSSIISLRKTVGQLETNYAVAPRQFDQRMADWEALSIELVNTNFGCREVGLHSPGSVADLETLRNEIQNAKQASAHLTPDRTYLQRLADWSVEALRQLS